jgi:hypothetical protein
MNIGNMDSNTSQNPTTVQANFDSTTVANFYIDTNAEYIS